MFSPVDGGGSYWDCALIKACRGLHARELSLQFANERECGQQEN